MKVLLVLISILILPIVWRCECAPKIPQASAISAGAASVAAAVAPQWYCETICAGGCGGRPHYDARKQVCRCTISEHERIDDGDMELIHKTADIIKMKIKFYNVVKVKRSLEDSQQEKSDEASEETETTTKVAMAPKKYTPFGPNKYKPFLFGDLAARFQKPQDEITAPTEDAILGQVDPTLEDTEPHHNTYMARSGRLFGGPILGQMNPSIKEIEPHHNIHAGYPAFPGPLASPGLPGLPAYPQHLTPALTRSLLYNVREKLDNLLLRTQQYPYQPAVTAHETESMRNTLKQITQVNVNVRPVGTTFGYFFNNLVNQLAPILRAEAPNATLVDDVDDNTQEEVVTMVPVSKENPKHTELKPLKTKHLKSEKVPVELGKKTSTKAPGTTMKLVPLAPLFVTTSKAALTSSEAIPVKVVEVVTVTVTPDKEQVHVTPVLAPIEQIFTTSSEPPTESTTGTTAKFLSIEEGDDLIGQSAEYLYEDDNDH